MRLLDIDPRGAIHFVDLNHNGMQLRKFEGGRLATVSSLRFAATGMGGPILGAHLPWAAGIAYDAAGHLFVADRNAQQILRIDADTQVVSVVAGSGEAGNNGDGPALSTKLDAPHGIAVTPDGDIYFTEQGGHRVRRISRGLVTTIAGTGRAASDGDGGASEAASLNGPRGIAIHPDGSIFVAELEGNRVRRIADGKITTALPGLNRPYSLAMAPSGDLLIGETEGGRLLRLRGGSFQQIAVGFPFYSVGTDPYGSIYVTTTVNAQFGCNNAIRRLRDSSLVTLAGRISCFDDPSRSAGPPYQFELGTSYGLAYDPRSAQWRCP